jgi:hypothetical protein
MVIVPNRVKDDVGLPLTDLADDLFADVQMGKSLPSW